MDPIDHADQLPKPSAERESRTLDFKETVSPANAYELAKDVAALANHFGGSILIGAAEDQSSGRLAAYRPLPTDFAHKVATAINQAVGERCRPSVVFEVKVFAFGSGSVLAVNVWPSVSQPIGVRVAAGEQYRGDAWTFPVRVGAETIYLSPEQIPLFMVPEIRRTAALLASVARERRTPVLVTIHGTRHGGHFAACVRQIRESENSATLQAVEKGWPTNEFAVPLDAIERVWRDFTGAWLVTIRGSIIILTQPNNTKVALFKD